MGSRRLRRWCHGVPECGISHPRPACSWLGRRTLLRRPGDIVETALLLMAVPGRKGMMLLPAMLLDVPLHSLGRHMEGERKAGNSPRHGWGGEWGGRGTEGDG